MLTLTPPQLAELEALGPYIVRLRLQVAEGQGHLAQMKGFRSGLMTRADVEEWLSQKDREDAEQERATFRRRARIAGWVGIVAVIATLAVGFLVIWLKGGGFVPEQWWRVR